MSSMVPTAHSRRASSPPTTRALTRQSSPRPPAHPSQTSSPSSPITTLLFQVSSLTIFSIVIVTPYLTISPIPDTVTSHYLASSGLETSDPRIVKLVSLAAQKFVSDVAADALNHCKMRQQRSINMVHSTLPKRKDKYVMTTEDLSQALGEQGVSVKKPPYYQ